MNELTLSINDKDFQSMLQKDQDILQHGIHVSVLRATGILTEATRSNITQRFRSTAATYKGKSHSLLDEVGVNWINDDKTSVVVDIMRGPTLRMFENGNYINRPRYVDHYNHKALKVLASRGNLDTHTHTKGFFADAQTRSMSKIKAAMDESIANAVKKANEE